MVKPANHVFVTPTNLLTWAEFTLRGAPGTWGLKEFRNIFLPNIGEDQKKSNHQSAGPIVLCHVVNTSLVITLRS